MKEDVIIWEKETPGSERIFVNDVFVGKLWCMTGGIWNIALNGEWLFVLGDGVDSKEAAREVAFFELFGHEMGWT